MFKKRNFWHEISDIEVNPNADINDLSEGVYRTYFVSSESQPDTEVGDYTKGYIHSKTADKIGAPSLTGGFKAVMFDDPTEPDQSYPAELEKLNNTESNRRLGTAATNVLERDGVVLEGTRGELDDGYRSFFPVAETGYYVDPTDIKTDSI
jgi:hypothetical protein